MWILKGGFPLPESTKRYKQLLIPLIILLIISFLMWYQGVIKNQNQEKSEAMMKNPVVTIQMADGNLIKIELYPEIATNTVNNFISLSKSGFYDGVIFHRVIEGFMIQGGDPLGTGVGGPGYSIKGEFRANGVENELKHSRGVLSMARSNNPDSAGSQFFIMHQDAAHLDGQYAAFGKVISGMEVVDQIATTKTDSQDRPIEEQKISKVMVETFGEDYEDPEKL